VDEKINKVKGCLGSIFVSLFVCVAVRITRWKKYLKSNNKKRKGEKIHHGIFFPSLNKTYFVKKSSKAQDMSEKKRKKHGVK